MSRSQSNGLPYRAQLGTQESSSEFNVISEDCGLKAGVHYECISINPVDTGKDDFDSKSVQVTYKEDEQLKGNLKYATVAVHESPGKVSDSRTISRLVQLQNDTPSALDAAKNCKYALASDAESLSCSSSSERQECEHAGMVASDSEALKFLQTSQTPAPMGAISGEAGCALASDEGAVRSIRMQPTADAGGEESEEEMFVSDPEALKFIKLTRKPRSADLDQRSHGILPSYTAGQKLEPAGKFVNSEANSLKFASDPGALKFFNTVTTAGSEQPPEEEPEIFASDPDALKFMKFMPIPSGSVKPKSVVAVSGADAQSISPASGEPSNATAEADDSNGIFVSDPEALKFVKLMRKVPAACADSPASMPTDDTILQAHQMDSRAFTRISPEAAATSDPQHCADASAADAATFGKQRSAGGRPDGDIVAEASVSLKDDRNYTVRVSGESLPNGLQKKVVDVSGSSGQVCSGVDVSKLQVSVEEQINGDGTVEKFVFIE